MRKEPLAKGVSLTPKEKNGKIVGKELLLGKDGARMWTNGTILVYVNITFDVSPADVEKFVKQLSY